MNFELLNKQLLYPIVVSRATYLSTIYINCTSSSLNIDRIKLAPSNYNIQVAYIENTAIGLLGWFHRGAGSNSATLKFL